MLKPQQGSFLKERKGEKFKEIQKRRKIESKIERKEKKRDFLIPQKCEFPPPNESIEPLNPLTTFK